MGKHIRPQLPDEILPHGEAPQGPQADERQIGQVDDLIRVERKIPQELLRLQPRVGKDAYPGKRNRGIFLEGKVESLVLLARANTYLLLEKSARCSFL